MSTRKAVVGYCSVMAVLGVAVFAVPPLRPVAWALVGLASLAAVLLGVRRHRPRRRYAWYLIGAGLAVFAAGDMSYSLTADSRGSASVLADIFYLAMFPLLATGLLGLTRISSTMRDRARFLDLLIFTTAVIFLGWVFVIGPLFNGGTRAVDRSAAAAYIFGALLVFATTVRLAFIARRNTAVRLLLIGATGLLVSDVLYVLALRDGGWPDGNPGEIGWLVFYTAWSAAALHPSMTALTEPAQPRAAQISRLWLVLLGTLALVGPAVLLLRALAGQPHDDVVISVVSGVMFVLVLSRFADVADAHRSAVGRERGLRVAGAALVSAAGADEVAEAVRTTVARLMPRGATHRMVFSVNRSDGVPAAAFSVWGHGAPQPYPMSGAAALRRTRMLRTGTLHPGLANQLRDYEQTLLCPMVLDEGAAGIPRVGALLVAAEAEVLVTLRDALEALAAQAALALQRISLSEEINRRNSEAYFRTIVQTTTDVILIVDDDHRLRYASPAVATVLGVEPAPGTPLGEIVAAETGVPVTELLAQARASGGRPGQWADWRLVRPDDTPVQVEASYRDLRRDRTVRGLVITLRDVTDRRRLEHELTHGTRHDALTGLANRTLFHDRVSEAVGRASETGRIVAALIIDFDDLTAVNETLGHTVGDELLIAVARRLTTAVGGLGTVARNGGDEFAALVDDLGSPAEAELVAEQVIAALAEPFTIDGAEVRGSVSIGIATTADAADAGELLRHADLALFVAKGDGKRRWRRYEASVHTAIVERLELRAALARAVSERTFTLDYQPIVVMGSGAILGFEALVRWRHPTLGFVPPAEFVAIAEETGLIEAIGDWVLHEAVRAVAGWRQVRAGRATPYVSVNVSAHQLRAPAFVDKVSAALTAAGVDPSGVMLEITESSLLRDDDRAWAELAALRRIGVRVAIDDFGTGFSSLSYLQRMPVDVLKIDRSFTSTISGSPRQRALVEAIVGLAGTLGLEVIAEGVESRVERDLLGDLGCPYGQGYLFSRPLAAAAATALLSGPTAVVPPARSTLPDRSG
ncbi:EAL domain-containing protein [Polymorphospora sp. NPDC051019]|uniref:EAL domain-containing protein n=1 Tax=Polymorphospora sp. NPDC051019 TaxID=3155725 RepID=UPI003419E3A0